MRNPPLIVVLCYHISILCVRREYYCSHAEGAHLVTINSFFCCKGKRLYGHLYQHKEDWCIPSPRCGFPAWILRISCPYIEGAHLDSFTTILSRTLFYIVEGSMKGNPSLCI